MIKFLNFNNKKKDFSNIDIDLNRIPKHIAIIMDGNGRWAKERKMPRTLGHKAGVEAIRDIVKECNNLGVKYLTLYAFSTENWKRPKDEVNALMKLLIEYLKSEIAELNKQNVVVMHIGDISKLPLICQDELNKAYHRTKHNSGLVLNLALNYGGRNELVYAIKGIAQDIKNGDLKIESINEELVSNYLYTKELPDPDIIIRTAGEQRLSNFLLWQCAYSEFWYTNIKWPDFRKTHLREAIYDYQNRDRRFGGLKQE
ncbi:MULTISPECIES: isoprenyl transferase [Clostridium]|uniref:Isoprenyl transferase n=2 Tax=Clostridium TaxID=1485 RepID=A0A151AQN1_9CLOT|nr:MULTISPECIES: isoprenyl transferase [Clostridium]MBE6079046.1 isoprenyl transferase [Clostridium lundense]KYH29892.1 ditrans,polycis-undecaprenyl-diphosphate synthase ((2E,6E)-farnesyl-diphosphate specific) [Clostridium colicanis DSM 13634]MBE6042653.1 isoprenyl transferase [Clostridium thermopalmarium]PRR75273.1 Ditrans,polycis-undecaprenyl-diphosphate synthase [Clostridium thermopalmarium DSM 5974]PVZ28029.1 undecaprenyl diphosphate synthase [Clostridium thermopalmarium DSM 5974]